jgi:hypothetical protein
MESMGGGSSSIPFEDCVPLLIWSHFSDVQKENSLSRLRSYMSRLHKYGAGTLKCKLSLFKKYLSHDFHITVSKIICTFVEITVN